MIRQGGDVMATIFWLITFVVLLVAEIVTLGLTTVWFAFGAILPCILAATTNLHYGWQIVIFLLISATIFLCIDSNISGTQKKTDTLYSFRFD